ncbi:DUF4399 domain-containing protein [Roseateles sp. DAIF2]|uniref:DUF4399 domain-containing protein n=1 Tax=Roseateles sp. DAIF2 TaxID=2714952 RepID=UPI0018A32753|nr:DUF4399 domain-containing protein [Roseateles sp. DAIF2]QPF72823.1 DUF4399 domain-containing protein [Roseateles sp. DAIF2]
MRLPVRLLPLVLSAALPAWGQTLPSDALGRRCWQSYSAERSAPDLREPIAVSFTNLRHGYALRSPFWVDFGVRGMGVIPAGNKNAQAGHHHILIDTPLPSNHQAQIPFSNTHRHFGKGQTGAELDLPDGKHTLRLLFADHEHRPYFVYSREITIEVVGRRSAAPLTIDPARFAASCAAWYQDQLGAPRAATREVYVKNLRSEESVGSPFLLSLGVTGLGVAPAGSALKDSGHFSVNISRAGAPAQRLDLRDGRTETVLDLPRGDYEIEARFLDGQGQVLLKAAPLRINVARQDR